MAVQRDDGRTALGHATEVLCCSTTSLPSPTGEIIVLRVVGEVDLSTGHVLRAALDDCFARRPGHVLVDLAELTFCDSRGLTLLLHAGRTGGACYAVGAIPRHVDRGWRALWPGEARPTQHPTAAAGVVAAIAGRADRVVAEEALTPL